jgi:hypothetical protein
LNRVERLVERARVDPSDHCRPANAGATRGLSSITVDVVA